MNHPTVTGINRAKDPHPLYAVVSARLLERSAPQYYRSQQGQLTVLIFLTENGCLSLTDSRSTQEFKIQHGTSLMLRGCNAVQQIRWNSPNTFIEIMTDDYFFSSFTSALALDSKNLNDTLFHYGPEADLAPIAARLAQKIRKTIHTSASLVRGGFHCPAMTRFILAMMLKARNPLHFRLEFKPSCLKLSDSRYLKVIQQIEQRLSTPIHVSDLAITASQSQFHFIRTFKARTGQSPHGYIQERRLRKAEYLLAETSISLAHISQECGFSSQSHFTTTFKQHIGLTPGQYRDQCVT